MTDTEKAALEARIDELCAEVERLRQEGQSIGMAAYELGRKSMASENAKLREERREYQGTIDSLVDECADHKAENDKLRELVRLLLWGIDNDMPRYEELAWSQKVNVLVRELGVEDG